MKVDYKKLREWADRSDTMKINYETIKAGDRVQIANGDWFEVEQQRTSTDLVIRNEKAYVFVDTLYDFGAITDHKPAEAKAEAEGLANFNTSRSEISDNAAHCRSR